MASENTIDAGSLRVLADITRKVGSGDITIVDLQRLLNRPPVHKWDGDASKLFLPPEQQTKIWRRYIAKRGHHTGQRETEIDQVPDAPVLTEEDIREGYDGVALFYGFNHFADSAEFGWEEIEMGRPHTMSRRITFNDSVLKLRSGAKPRPTGWFWRKVNLTPVERYEQRSDAIRYLDPNEFLMSFEWFQLFGITHYHLADYLCAFPDHSLLGGRVRITGRPEFPSLYLGDLELAPLWPRRCDDRDYEKNDSPATMRVSRMTTSDRGVWLSAIDPETKFVGYHCWPVLRD